MSSMLPDVKKSGINLAEGFEPYAVCNALPDPIIVSFAASPGIAGFPTTDDIVPETCWVPHIILDKSKTAVPAS